MAQNARDPEEIQRLLKALRKGEVFNVSFVFQGASPNSFTNDAFSSLEVPMTYAIVGVSLSAVHTEATTQKNGLLALTRSSAHGHYPSDKKLVGVDIARLAIAGGAASKNENFGSGPGGGDGFERPSIIIPKGQTIYAHLHSNTADGNIDAEISIKVLPVYDQ